MKRIFILAAVLATASFGFSQLSTRENAETIYQIGTRPQAGDFGLMFGVPFSSNDNFVPINLLRSGDLITGKYYFRDDIAFRGGIKLMKSTEIIKGEGNDDFDPTAGGELVVDNSKTNEREFDLRIGAEKHFTNSNIFDVYTGADLHLGFGKNESKSRQEFKNGDYDEFNTKVAYRNIGVTPFVGVQVFILDLPISVGVEYGIDAIWSFGKNIEKVNSDNKTGAVTTTEEFYQFADGSGGPYSKLRGKSVEINSNQNVKLVANIYFGGKPKTATIAN